MRNRSRPRANRRKPRPRRSNLLTGRVGGRREGIVRPRRRKPSVLRVETGAASSATFSARHLRPAEHVRLLLRRGARGHDVLLREPRRRRLPSGLVAATGPRFSERSARRGSVRCRTTCGIASPRSWNAAVRRRVRRRRFFREFGRFVRNRCARRGRAVSRNAPRASSSPPKTP